MYMTRGQRISNKTIYYHNIMQNLKNKILKSIFYKADHNIYIFFFIVIFTLHFRNVIHLLVQNCTECVKIKDKPLLKK